VTMKNVGFWDVMPCGFLTLYFFAACVGC
jgi:hypothetical protein